MVEENSPKIKSCSINQGYSKQNSTWLSHIVSQNLKWGTSYICTPLLKLQKSHPFWSYKNQHLLINTDRLHITFIFSCTIHTMLTSYFSNSNNKIYKLGLGVFRVVSDYLVSQGRHARVGSRNLEVPSVKNRSTEPSLSFPWSHSIQSLKWVERIWRFRAALTSPLNSGRSATFINFTPLYLFLMASILLPLRHTLWGKKPY